MSRTPSTASSPHYLRGLISASKPSLSKLARSRLESLRQTRQTNPLADLDLAEFIPAVTPKWQRPDHLAPLIDLFERADRGESIRALVSVPPRHGKTETLLHAIARTLVRHPDHVCAYASYADQFARSKSRSARDYAIAAGVRLRDDSAALNEWRTGDGGGCLAMGVGGPLTGHGVHRLIVDDPIKNRRDAESATIRETIHGWFTSTAMTRVERGGSVFVVHTRWHPDDLIGRLAADRDVAWEVVNLAAIDNDGAALWPERWPVDALREREREVGAYDWASMYQGQPRPRGGSVFNDPRFCDAVPTSGVRYAIGIDLAYTAKTSSDYSVAVVLAECAGTVYVVDVLREQVSQPTFARLLKGLCAQYRGARIVGYLAGTERGAADFIVQTGVPFTPTTAKGDKFVRAQPYAAGWNAGRVMVPRDAEWAEPFLLEHARFTGMNDAHDDQIDAAAAAYDQLANPSQTVFVGGERSFGAASHDERGW